MVTFIKREEYMRLIQLPDNRKYKKLYSQIHEKSIKKRGSINSQLSGSFCRGNSPNSEAPRSRKLSFPERAERLKLFNCLTVLSWARI